MRQIQHKFSNCVRKFEGKPVCDRKFEGKPVMQSRFISTSRSELFRVLDDNTMLANKPEHEEY